MAKRKPKKTGRTRANGEGSIWIDPKTKHIYALITWSETVNGKPVRKRRMRRAVNKTHAYELLPQLRKDVDQERRLRAEQNNDPEPGGPKPTVNPARLTLGELSKLHLKENLQPTKRTETDVKISGLNSWRDAQDKIRMLVQYFGAGKLVCSITLANVKRFRIDRLNTPKQSGYWTTDKKTGKRIKVTEVRINPATGKPGERAVASVHREIAALRRMLNYAVEEGWLLVNPIAGKKGLVNPAEENKRIEIASPTAEKALLEQCNEHPRRRHLVPYLMTAFDHGCRSIELRRMLVQDIDFATNSFHVYSYKGKQRHDRKLKMTPRVCAALLECCAGKQPTDHVFTYGKKKQPLKYAPKTSFKTAKRLAKFWSDDKVDLDQFRGHDARHTYITRLVKSGMSLDEAGKHAGHMQPSTTWRYLNPDDHSRDRAADLIANYTESESVVDFATAKAKRKRTA